MKSLFDNKSRMICKVITLLVIIMMCMSLVSCGNTDGDNEQADNTPTETSHLHIRVTGDLHDGAYLEHGAKTSHGYYEIITWPESMMPEDHGYTWYGNVVYTDYATCQKVFLCNTPGCPHNTQDCTSFVSYSSEARLFTDYSEKHLYLISLGVHTDDIRPADLASITEMNMDGSGRRTVCSLTSEEVFSGNTVEIASDEYLYAMIGHIEMVPNKEDKLVPTEQYLLERIWFSDGRRETVCELHNGSDQREGLLSVWGEEDLIINQRVFKDDSPSELYRCRISQDGDLIEKFGPVGTFAYYSDQFMITGEEDGTSAAVTAIDYKTGERTTINDVPAETGVVGRVIVHNRDENKIHWSFLDTKEVFKCYILDFSEGTCKEFTLRQTDTYDDMPIGIIADAGNDYYVIVGEQDTTLELTDVEGIPHVFPLSGYPRYALISKQDYWNCVPNYRMIEDKVMSTG